MVADLKGCEEDYTKGQIKGKGGQQRRGRPLRPGQEEVKSPDWSHQAF